MSSSENGVLEFTTGQAERRRRTVQSLGKDVRLGSIICGEM
jgi:hypothetical protein